MESTNAPQYELWLTEGPDVAVVSTGYPTSHTAGYVTPQSSGGWIARVSGEERCLMFPDEHTAAEYVHRAYCSGSGGTLSSVVDVHPSRNVSAVFHGDAPWKDRGSDDAGPRS